MLSVSYIPDDQLPLCHQVLEKKEKTRKGWNGKEGLKRKTREGNEKKGNAKTKQHSFR